MTDMTNGATKKSRKLKKTLFALGLGAVAGFIGAYGFMELVDGQALGALGPSREIAGLVAILYIFTSIAVLAGVVAPRAGATFLNVEDAEELREQKFQLAASGMGMIAAGAALLVAALAAPIGPIAPTIALIGFAALMIVAVLASIASHRRQDELMRAIGRETGALAFYLVVLVGGGWSLAAHLDFTTGPAPLDWLTMFWGIMLVAAFAVIGRRGMLTMR